MKSWNHIFDMIVEPANIEFAIRRSSRGKRDRLDVRYCFDNSSSLAADLSALLKFGEYCPPDHVEKEINDGITRKKRFIVEPIYNPEQIIHHAIVQVLVPIIDGSSYEYSCGSMPNRGGTHGKKYIEKFLRKNRDKETIYTLKMDIRHFFQTIDHNVLKSRFRKYFHDDKFNNLIDKIIDGYHSSEGFDKGIPIGFYTSQWFANWYLQDMDYYIKQTLKAKCYVRYMDDLVILASNKRYLRFVKNRIIRFLKTLKLEVNNKWQIFPMDSRPLDFMGFRFYRNKTTLRRTILLRATRKAKRMQKITWYNSAQMLSYLGWFKHCNVHNVYRNYIRPYVNPKRLRRCLSAHSRRLNNEIKLVPKRKYTDTKGYRSIFRCCAVA